MPTPIHTQVQPISNPSDSLLYNLYRQDIFDHICTTRSHPREIYAKDRGILNLLKICKDAQLQCWKNVPPLHALHALLDVFLGCSKKLHCPEKGTTRVGEVIDNQNVVLAGGLISRLPLPPSVCNTLEFLWSSRMSYCRKCVGCR